MPIIQGPAGALDLFEDVGGFRGPDERLGLIVVLVDVSTDGHDQLLDIAEGTSSQARPINLTLEERSVLEQHSRARSMPARIVERARIVLRAASGLENQQIADELNITPEKVARWRKRFGECGFTALEKDAPRPGGPRTITDKQIMQVVTKTTQETPSNSTHWSTRTMAAAVGMSEGQYSSNLARPWIEAAS